MYSIKLMTDSGSDVPKAFAAQHGIDVLPFPLAVAGEEFIPDDNFTNAMFYEILMKEPKIPTHAQITTVEFVDKYEEYYKQGYADLIYVSINKLGSNTYNNAVLAKQQFFDEHPEAAEKFSVHVVDSKIYSAGYGYPVMEAAKKIERGCSAKEILAYLDDWFDSVEIYFAPYSLEFVKKSGRVSCAAAFVGELLGLKPIICFVDGQVSVVEKVRGEKAIIPTLLKYAKNKMIPQTPYLFITGCLPEESAKFKQEAEKVLGYASEGSYEAGPVIAINAGPKLVAIVVKGHKKH